MKLGHDAAPDILPERVNHVNAVVGSPNRTRATMSFAAKIPHGHSAIDDRKNSRILRVVNRDSQR